MRTEDLIRELAKDAPPVRRLQPFAIRLAGWLALAAVSLAVVTMWMGARRMTAPGGLGVEFSIRSGDAGF